MNSYVVQKITLFLMAAALLAAFVLPAEAAFGPTINYQGKLTTPSGSAVPNGTYNVRVWLLTGPSIATTSAIWNESLTGGNKVQVTDGLFSIMLGSTSSLASIDFSQVLYLGVEIGGTGSPSWDGEMSPRKVLGAVPAAFESRKLGGVASTSFLRSDEADAIAASTATTLLSITQSGAGDILNLFDGGTKVFTIIDGGLVGIGTSTPSQELTVVGDLRLTGRIYDTLNSAGSNGSILKSTGTGQTWVATSTLGLLAQSQIDSCSELSSIVGGTIGTCGSLVLSASPTFTGLVQAAAATLSSTLPTKEASLGEKFCRHTMASNQMLIVPDATLDVRFQLSPHVLGEPHVRFYVSAPLLTEGGDNLGTICAISATPREFGERDQKILRDLAGIVMHELAVRQIASVDSLTGCLARRAFKSDGQRHIALAMRHRHQLSLIAFDLDHFKSINDGHGHSAGDAVLRAVADVCRDELRQTDLFGRLGGEEFANLLPQTDAAGHPQKPC